MSFNGISTREASVDNQSPRTTGTVTGSAVGINEAADYVIDIINTLDQAGNVQLQWSVNGTTWTNLGSQIAAAATTNLLAAVPTPKPFYGWIRATYTATVAPGAGSITVAVQKNFT